MGLPCGDPRDGAKVRGVGGKSLGVRGMQHSDAGLPQSLLNDGQPGPSTLGDLGINRGRRAGLGGLAGGLGNSVAPAVDAGLAQLVSVAQEETAKIVDAAGFLSRGAVRDWAENIVSYVKSVQTTLTAKRDGVSFYARQPESAARTLANTSRELRSMINELNADTNNLVPGSLGANFDMIIAGTVDGLVSVADTAVRAAVKSAGELPDLPSGLPGWVAPAAGLVAALVLWRVLA